MITVYQIIQNDKMVVLMVAIVGLGVNGETGDSIFSVTNLIE